MHGLRVAIDKAAILVQLVNHVGRVLDQVAIERFRGPQGLFNGVPVLGFGEQRLAQAVSIPQFECGNVSCFRSGCPALDSGHFRTF